MNEPFFSPLIEHAIELAAQWHDSTYRKGRWRSAAFQLPDDQALGVPVMAHVTAVAMTVQRAGWDETAVAAAFLHDALEDVNRYGQTLRREQLLAHMGEAVTALIARVTEEKYDAEGRFRSWRARKVDYVAHLRTASAPAVAISLADKLHNLWSMNESLARGIDVFTNGPNRRALSAGPEEQRWFYEAVLDVSEAYADARLAPMRVRLRQEMQRFEALTELPGPDAVAQPGS